jgi:acyl carrier protein
MDTIKELEKFLLSEVAIDLEKKSIALDEDLISSGIIDSMGILKLTAFLQQKFNIQIQDKDMNVGNFKSINSLKYFIETKLRKDLSDNGK